MSVTLDEHSRYEFKPYTLSYVPGEDCEQIRVVLGIQKAGKGNQSEKAWFDEVCLTGQARTFAQQIGFVQITVFFKEGAAIVEGYVAAEDGEGAKAVAEAAKEDISAATSATEIEGIVDGAKLDIEKERAEEQIYGFAGENLSAEAEAIIEEYLGEPDGKNHIGGNRKRNARRSR